MKNRIGNIEFRKYPHDKRKGFYEIVKWQSNPYYGREQEYRDNGYVDSFLGDSLTNNGRSIQKTSFSLPETCYVLAFVEKGNESWELRSVGERLLELTPEEVTTFFEVYRKGQKKLNKTKI